MGTQMTDREQVNIVVPGDDPVQIQGSPELDRLGPYGQVRVYTDRPRTLEEQVDRARDAEVIINSRSIVKWPEEALRALPKLRMMTVCGIGTDAIDVEVASELGVAISNQPGRTSGVVAEHIFGLMFAVAKRAAFQTAELKAGRWTRMDSVLLQGKTLGVVGTGNVGSEVARLARAVGMDVVAWTFHPSLERASRLGVRFVELDELLRLSDVVSLSVTLTSDTQGMIGERELGLMKRGALLVNGGRGQLVDTEAMVRALDSGHLGGAALDVFDVEPLPPDHPILSCRQVVLTPHLADQTPEGMELLNSGAVDNVIAFLEGRPQHVVNP
ncbi:MAG: NAD(P)-dependent oxidoreductase [SAR202 cluster bacterium]|nr:NAD(P)-dependent oxidoreductase [SAR202 cluster bacterium]